MAKKHNGCCKDIEGTAVNMDLIEICAAAIARAGRAEAVLKLAKYSKEDGKIIEKFLRTSEEMYNKEIKHTFLSDFSKRKNSEKKAH